MRGLETLAGRFTDSAHGRIHVLRQEQIDRLCPEFAALRAELAAARAAMTQDDH